MSRSRSPVEYSYNMRTPKSPTRGSRTPLVGTSRERKRWKDEMDRIEKTQFDFAIDFDKVPILPERYLDQKELDDFSVMEKTFQQALASF